MPAVLEQTDIVFRAFTDQTRIRLLNLLLEREVCVCDLCVTLNMPQPKVSRHLAFLRRAGLVRVRRRGKWKHYAALTPPPGLERSLLDCVRGCLREIDVLQRDLAKLTTAQTRNGCP